MPDINGNYLGDRATVIPSNTEALLHFSNLFAQKAAQRQAQKAAQEKADMERRIEIQKYLGDRLNSKDFETNATHQGSIDTGLNNIRDWANKNIDNLPADQMYAGLNKLIGDMKMQPQKINELDKGIIAGVANYAKQYPGIDVAALGSFAKHDASYKRDKNGNWAIKNIISEIDPSQDWVGKAYKEHYADLFPEEVSSNTWKKRMDNEKLSDVNELPKYDAQQNVINIPYKGKLPGFVTIKKDTQGNTLRNDNGSPKIDILGSQDYKLDGEVYRDDKGQKVRVVSDNIFQDLYHGAIGAGIEKQVREILKTPVNLDGTGETKLSPDSDYADMLRKKLLYDKLKADAEGRYKFTTLDDKSFERQNTLRGRQLQEAQLAISRHNSNRSDQKFNWEKNKAAIGGENGVPPLTDKYESKTGKTTINPLTGKPIKYIEVNTIDKGDLQTITGNKVSSVAGESPDNIKPFDTGGKKVFLIDDNGDWYGQDNDGELKPIDRDAAYRRQVNAGKKGNAAVVAPPKQNVAQKIINRVKQAVTPTKKILQGNVR